MGTHVSTEEVDVSEQAWVAFGGVGEGASDDGSDDGADGPQDAQQRED